MSDNELAVNDSMDTNEPVNDSTGDTDEQIPRDNISCDENNDDGNVTDSDSVTEATNDNSAGVMNTVLAYIHYGISSATPDNVLKVACTHFTPDEIISAKNKLWRECNRGTPPPRNNSNRRRASEAHVQDIIDELFKIDKDDNFVFCMESGGIARLPKFNAECLNVVTFNQRLEELNEQCYVNKMEASSYRSDFLRCQDQIQTMQTVLQQHTDALRMLRNDNGTYGYQPSLSASGITVPKSLASQLSVVSQPLACTSKPIVTSSPCQSSTTSQSPVTSSSSLTPESNMTRPSVTSSSLLPPSDNTTKPVMTSSSSSSSGAAVPLQPTYASLFPHQSIPAAFTPRSNVAAGRSGGVSMLSQGNPSQPASGSDNDGFRKTPRDIKNASKREQHRIKVVHSTKNNSGSRFKGALQICLCTMLTIVPLLVT